MFFISFFGLILDLLIFGVLVRFAYPYRRSMYAFLQQSSIIKQIKNVIPKIPEKKKDYSQSLSVGYETVQDLKLDIRSAGIESSDLLVFIDFTKSNLEQGKDSFEGRCLHDLECEGLNPYEDVIQIIAATLGAYDDDGQIPLYGFGDLKTTNKDVFSIGKKNGMPIEDLLKSYRSAAKTVIMSGPTSYTPCIEKAVSISEKSNGYHIALILTDGCTLYLKKDLQALREASNYPISFVIVGVGDGPWDKAEKLDDDDNRVFDNLNFVAHSEFKERGEKKNDAFILEALKEIPEQFRMIHDLNLLE